MVLVTTSAFELFCWGSLFDRHSTILVATMQAGDQENRLHVEASTGPTAFLRQLIGGEVAALLARCV